MRVGQDTDIELIGFIGAKTVWFRLFGGEVTTAQLREKREYLAGTAYAYVTRKNEPVLVFQRK